MLSTHQRLVAGGIAVITIGAAVVYDLRIRTTVVAAPSCQLAPSGCVIRVSQPPETAVIIALLVISALFAVWAITARVWNFAIAGHSASIATEPALETTGVSEEVADEVTEAESYVSRGAEEDQSLTNEQSRELYLTLPIPVALTAEQTWRTWYPDELLSDCLQEVRDRPEGKGNHPYFLRAKSPRDTDTWIRVTRGGKGSNGILLDTSP